MSADVVLSLLARCLPALIVFILGFLAAGDNKTRQQWTNMLYQAGSLKPSQRDDPAIQNRVKIPFFVVAAFLLIWPIQFYRHATRMVEITPESDIFKTQAPQLDRNQKQAAPAAPNANAAASPGTAPGVAPEGIPAPPLSPSSPAQAPAAQAPAVQPPAAQSPAAAPANPGQPHL